MTLADLKPGQLFLVAKITLTREIGKRLVDMGLIPGTRGKVIRFAHVGDPIEVEVQGSHLLLRKNEARGIEVSVITGEA